MYMLVESKIGYVWSNIIYTRKGTQLMKEYKDLPKSSQVEMTLMKLLKKGHCLTTDNFYTSPELANLLVNHYTDTYRTVKQTEINANTDQEETLRSVKYCI